MIRIENKELQNLNCKKIFKGFKKAVQNILKINSTKVGIFLLIGLICLATAPKLVNAKIIFNPENKNGNIELIIKNKDKKNQVEIVSLDEIGKNQTTEKINDSFFEEIKNYKYQTPGVNYLIADPKRFENFILSEAKKYTEEKDIELNELKPNEIITLTTKILEDNLTYNESGDDIDNVPLDILLMDVKKCVCRHYSALYKTVFDKLIVLSNSPYLKNTITQEITNNEIHHAYNAIYELENQNTDHKIKLGFLDATWNDQNGDLNAWDNKHPKNESLAWALFGDKTSFSDNLDIFEGLQKFYLSKGYNDEYKRFTYLAANKKLEELQYMYGQYYAKIDEPKIIKKLQTIWQKYNNDFRQGKNEIEYDFYINNLTEKSTNYRFLLANSIYKYTDILVDSEKEQNELLKFRKTLEPYIKEK
ncbi:MAG: hypothetical protein WCX88_00180 [Patescibacteria group bacterium]